MKIVLGEIYKFFFFPLTVIFVRNTRMKPNLIILALLSFSLFNLSCTLSEMSTKTKDTFNKSTNYLKKTSENAYRKTREAFGGESTEAKTPKPMSVSKTKFDILPDGTQVNLYKISNANGMHVSILDYGGTVKEIHAPDRNGKFANVSLGFSTINDYIEKSPYFGCITGRYANRIAKGKFSLEGKEYKLATNNGPNHLHGGNKGFDKYVWKAKVLDVGTGVIFTRKSPHGEEGYPGNLDCKVTYTLTNDNELKVEYEAKTDQATIVNLTNHTYFNLRGEGNGNILGHELTIPGDRFVATDETNIPIGISKVGATPFDFRKPTSIGARIEQKDSQLKFGKGYDHTWVVPQVKEGLSLAARLRDKESGRVLEILTDQPGIQIYTGNYLDGIVGHGGKAYPFRSGLCLETQVYPDSPNHQGEKGWKSCVLLPGDIYTHTTIHRFKTD